LCLLGRVSRLDAHPGLRPVLPARSHLAAAAEPQARRTAEHGGYVPPVLEVLGLAEVEHNARNNRMRAR
jgi:hypothetical protein